MAGDTSYQPKVYRKQGGDELHVATAGYIIVEDSGFLTFGDASDIVFSFDGTNLVATPATDDTGAIHIGDGTTDMDLKWFGGTTAKYVLFDMGNALLQLEDVDLKLGDNDILQFGDATGGDVSVKWNGTNLVILPAADDTGAIYFGDGTTDMDVRVTLGAAADYAQFDVGAKSLIIAGDARLDLSSATVAAANTDGGVIKCGTSAARVTEDTADMKFLAFYFDNGATSGDNRGVYLRQYLTGAGGGGEAARIFTTVEDVAGGTVHGAHISLNFGTSGTLTGLGVAVRGTLHIGQSSSWSGGSCAALQAEIYSDHADADPAGMTSLACIRVVNDGSAKDDVDDDAVLFDFAGWTVADGNMIAVDGSPTTCPNITNSFKVRLPDGSLCYLYAGASAVTA